MALSMAANLELLYANFLTCVQGVVVRTLRLQQNVCVYVCVCVCACVYSCVCVCLGEAGGGVCGKLSSSGNASYKSHPPLPQSPPFSLLSFLSHSFLSNCI